MRAAGRMRDDNNGSRPVAEGDGLVGYVTNRDLVVRGLAQGFSADTPVQGIMTDRVIFCLKDEDVEDVALNMAQNQVRRLPVLSREKRLVDVLALGDRATKVPDLAAEDALEGESKPTG